MCWRQHVCTWLTGCGKSMARLSRRRVQISVGASSTLCGGVWVERMLQSVPVSKYAEDRLNGGFHCVRTEWRFHCVRTD